MDFSHVDARQRLERPKEEVSFAARTGDSVLGMQHHLFDELTFVQGELLDRRCTPLNCNAPVRALTAIQPSAALDGDGLIRLPALTAASFPPGASLLARSEVDEKSKFFVVILSHLVTYRRHSSTWRFQCVQSTALIYAPVAGYARLAWPTRARLGRDTSFVAY
jgi:hypothetical protein